MATFEVRVRRHDVAYDFIVFSDSGIQAMDSIRRMMNVTFADGSWLVEGCRWVRPEGSDSCPECGADDNEQCFPHCAGRFSNYDFQGGE